ncbi:MAG: hypothetical protein IPP37_00585 [Saprospiraceae bacterium]|nr:hypothetical protein [Saprospiraceae bacterium]
MGMEILAYVDNDTRKPDMFIIDKGHNNPMILTSFRPFLNKASTMASLLK